MSKDNPTDADLILNDPPKGEIPVENTVPQPSRATVIQHDPVTGAPIPSR